jgi:hypothetical protein
MSTTIHRKKAQHTKLAHVLGFVVFIKIFTAFLTMSDGKHFAPRAAQTKQSARCATVSLSANCQAL